MRPILFAKNATTFTTNGLGRVECESCKVIEELNGMYELEAVVPETGQNADLLEMEMILVARPAYGVSFQPFRIYKITKPINGKFTVLAQHISYQLSYIPVMPFSVDASQSAAATVLAKMKTEATETCPFTFSTDVTIIESYTQTLPDSIRYRLLGAEDSVLKKFGGEFEWDKYHVILHRNRGKTTPDTILKYGKNITDITQEEYISDTITGIVPYWTYADGAVLTLPEKVVESQYADSYAYRRTVPLDLSHDFDNRTPTEAELRATAVAYLNKYGVGIPTISIEVSFVDLHSTEEYADVASLETVNLGDIITVRFEKLGIDEEAKIVKTEWDVLAEKYISVNVGTIKQSLAHTISNTNGVIDTFLDQTRFEVRNATAWLTGSNGYVMAVKNQDGTWKELLFLDTNDARTAHNVLRINENGIGFSRTGVDGPYTQAWTLDGRMVIGGTNVPSLTVYDNLDSILFQIDKDGMMWNAPHSSMTKTGIINAENMIASGSLTSGNEYGNRIRIVNGHIYGDWAGNQVLDINTRQNWSSGYITGEGVNIYSDLIGIDGRLLTRLGGAGTYYVAEDDGTAIVSIEESSYTTIYYTHIDNWTYGEYGAHGDTTYGYLPTSYTDNWLSFPMISWTQTEVINGLIMDSE